VYRSTRIAVCLLVLVFTIASFAKNTQVHLKEVSDEKYKPGQVWSYKTRTNESESTLTILRVEKIDGKKSIVHIRVDRIVLKNCSGGPEPEQLPHMPFSREAIDASVLKVLRTGQVPDFHEGYSEWRSAWDSGKAGFYTITVAQALDVSHATFNQGLGCSK
jgi:hypothetical protein